MKRMIFLLTISLLLWSCGRSNGGVAEIWQNKRKNIEKVEVVSITDSLPAMHDMTYPVGILGDTLIFFDFQSTDSLFAAYNVASGKFLGWFGRFGNGPGEIANFGDVCVDVGNRILYGKNCNQWNYVGFKLDSAIGAPAYKPFLKAKILSDGEKYPSTSMGYVSDTAFIVAASVPDEDWTAFTFRLGSFNPTTGRTTLFDHPEVEPGADYYVSVDTDKNLVVAAGREVDRIILFDLEGNIKRSIYGPLYNGKAKKGCRYNYVPVITDDKICVVYRDIYEKEGKKVRLGKEIVELDLEGNYLRTLKSPVMLIRLAYHKETNRLYFSSREEPQFGYIQL